MKKIFSLLTVLALALTVNARVVTWDFTNASFLRDTLGLTLPADGQATNLSGVTLSYQGITISFVKVAKTDNRIWNGSGSYDLRMYTNSTMTIACADEPITGITMSGAATAFNELTAGSWTGSSNSVTFTANATCKISKIVVTIDETPVIWTPDTITVSEAIALVDQQDDHNHYVIGVVVSDPWNAYNSFPGLASFNMVDGTNSSDTIQAFNVGKGDIGTKFQTEDEAKDMIHVGDTVLVFASALSYFEAKKLYEINGGYFDSVIGEAAMTQLEYTFAEALYLGQDENGKYDWQVNLLEEEDGDPAVTMLFSNKKEHGIAGRYTLDSTTVVAGESVVSGSLNITYAQAGEVYNQYNLEAIVQIDSVMYRISNTYEMPAYTAGYAAPYSLSDDVPYVPQEGDTITCAQAADYALNTLAEGTTADFSVTVIGYVTSTDGVVSKGQQVFWMSDEKGSTKTLQAYWANLPDGITPIPVDAKVALTGKLMNFSGKTAEIKNGDIVILEGGNKPVDRDLNFQPVPEDAISIAEAMAKGQALADNTTDETEVTVVGYIGKVAFQTANDTASWYMCDAITGETFFEFEAYKCAIDNYIQAGDYVFVTGKITKYVGEKGTTIEIKYGQAYFAEAATAIDQTAAERENNSIKRIINGQLVILRDGKTYSVTGVEL
ncbi:MAG: hypothetical protein MJZ82_04090 [Paludibacteraceae bacterium]|nr:hypothetical protein [Paludibacteraceae bacterium]